jgi:hypothetical protein
MNKRILIGLGILLLVVLAAGGGFYAGTVSAQGARQGFNRGQFAAGQGGQFQRADRTPQPGQPDNARMGPGGGVMGTIKSAEGNTLVVTTSDGDTQVHVTDTTLIEKYTTVNVGDLSAGERVVVSGSQNDDGSITARSIQSMRNFQAPQSQ